MPDFQLLAAPSNTAENVGTTGAESTGAEALEHIAELFTELGLVVIGLALLARFANRIGLTPIPFYLVAGLAFGQGGVYPLHITAEFISVGAEIGVILLLFMLGLEYSSAELSEGLRRGWRGGVLDGLLNFLPGLGIGFLFGFDFTSSILLGGVTWISSSSIIAKVLGDLDRLGNRETPPMLSILVLEDLAMAVYLPLVAVLLLGLSALQGAISVGIALFTVAVVLLMALRFGTRISNLVSHRSDEVVLLTVFGLVLVVAGIAQKLQVSAAIGAFLVGLALSGSVAERARDLLGPLRDLFAAVFFFFVGLQIVPASLPSVLWLALALALITALTKMATGWITAGWSGIGARGRLRAALTLVARGEFSVVIASLGSDDLKSLAAAYVLILAIGGPVLARYSDAISEGVERVQARLQNRGDEAESLAS